MRWTAAIVVILQKKSLGTSDLTIHRPDYQVPASYLISQQLGMTSDQIPIRAITITTRR